MSSAFILASHPRQMEAFARPSVILISAIVAGMIPLILAVYWFVMWFAPDFAASLLRLPLLGLAGFLALIWHRAPLTHAEMNLLKTFGIAATIMLFAAFTATNPSGAVSGWLKLVLLFATCLFVARGLRHPASAHFFGISLLACGVALTAFILFLYIWHLGVSLPSFKTAREFKAIAQTDGISLNSVAFAAVFSYLSGLCLMHAKRALIITAIPLFAVSSMFTGSRAPIAILGASLLVLLGINGWRRKFRVAVILLVLAAAAGVGTLIAQASDKDLTTATEGRWHLWSVGLHKFAERPLFGYGYESWRDDLVSRLPGERSLTYELAKNSGGAYHNQYVTLLSEEGLLGAGAAGIVIWLLVRSSWLLSFRRWATNRTAQWSLFACIFLLLRANFEVPGLFGYAQDPVDYLAYILLAIVLSRFSVEEDFARTR